MYSDAVLSALPRRLRTASASFDADRAVVPTASAATRPNDCHSAPACSSAPSHTAAEPWSPPWSPRRVGAWSARGRVRQEARQDEQRVAVRMQLAAARAAVKRLERCLGRWRREARLLAGALLAAAAAAAARTRARSCACALASWRDYTRLRAALHVVAVRQAQRLLHDASADADELAAEAAAAAEEAEKAEKRSPGGSALNSLANSPVKALVDGEEAKTPPSRLALFKGAGARVMSGPRMASVVEEARAAQAVAEARVLAAAETVEREGHRGFGVTRRWRATYDDFLECLARCAATQMGGGSELGSGVGRLCEAITESVRKGPDHLPEPEPASLGPHLEEQQARLQLPLSMAEPRLVSTNNQGSIKGGPEAGAPEVAPTPPAGKPRDGRPGSGTPRRPRRPSR